MALGFEKSLQGSTSKGRGGGGEKRGRETRRVEGRSRETPSVYTGVKD